MSANPAIEAAAAHFRLGEYSDVLSFAPDCPLSDLSPTMALLLGSAHAELGDDGAAIDLLLHAVEQSPKAKSLRLLCRVLRRTPRRDAVDRLAALVFERFADNRDFTAYLAPLLDVHYDPQAATPEQHLLAFHAFAERGMTQAAIEVGLVIIARNPRADDVRARVRDLLLAAGRIGEALALSPQGPKMADIANMLRPIVGGPKTLVDVVALAEVTALGDFIQRLIAISKMKRHCPMLRVALCYRNDRPFKRDLARATHFIDETFEVTSFSREHLEAALGARRYSYSFIINGEAFPMRNMGSFEGDAWFRTPDTDEAELSRELVAAGVDPNRWFVSLHYRQGATAPDSRVDAHRDVQSANFHDLAKHLTEACGGQVVRLGHPGLDPVPPIEGYVDLSQRSIALQLFAVSRSRFMIGTDSGMVGFGVGCAVPTGRTNVIYEINQENPDDIILLRNIVSTEGYAVSSARKFREGGTIVLTRVPDDPGLLMFENTLDQLKVVVDRLLTRTDSVVCWRPRSETGQAAPPDGGGPFRTGWRRRAEVLDLAEMLGLPVVEV